jgi:hypothetical protein
MNDDTTPDPLRVLELARAAEALADELAGETGCETVDAVAVLDALGALGLTLTRADAVEADAIAAAYLSF